MQAYFDCRASKRNSDSALRFEIDLERNLVDLDRDLRDGTYTPGKSICFVITRPKPREVWAAQFRDRIVHHLLYNRVAPTIQARFIHDSCACIQGRGTLFGAIRLEKHTRSITRDWTRSAHYLKCDLANFFVAIDKEVLLRLLSRHIQEDWWYRLARQILMHDPRQDYEIRGPRSLIARVPTHKRLTEQPATHGLPIGNLSSQFFANIYLNELDQFIKHQLKARYYVRYVDDFVLLHEDPAWLNQALSQIKTFLQVHLHARLNPSKTILQPAHRGIDFVGQLILPHRRITRRRTVSMALKRTADVPIDQIRDTANSYFGMLRQASHSRNDQAKLARLLLRRGKAVNAALTQTYGSTTKSKRS